MRKRRLGYRRSVLSGDEGRRVTSTLHGGRKMRKMLWATAGAMALLVATACTDSTVLTDAGRRLAPHNPAFTQINGAGFTTINADEAPGGDLSALCKNGNPL